MFKYEHEQPGTLLRITLGGGLLIFGVMAVSGAMSGNEEQLMVCSIASAIFVVLVALFHSLTLRVSQNEIVLFFGVGLIRKSFPIKDVQRVQCVRNHWFYGWGIRWIPGGWLFNVSGLDAVELQMRNGRRYRIGTDEPQQLQSAVESAMENVTESDVKRPDLV